MKKADSPILFLRSIAFYAGFYASIIIWSTASMAICPFLSRTQRVIFINRLNRFIIWWLGVTCNITIQISGMEHVQPGRACVILSNHQSVCETFLLQTLFSPVCTVLKKELLNIPFFGWTLRFLNPIAIDRRKRIRAYRQIMDQGREALTKGNSILVFPEGTHHTPEAPGIFFKGGASLASATGYPVIPVVHNAGCLWPSYSFFKTPGKITVIIGPEIDSSNRSTNDIHEHTSLWMKNKLKEITV